MKRILSILLVLALSLGTLSLTACTTNDSSSDSQSFSSSSQSSAETYEVSYPVTLTDQAGRTVTVESEPQTLVSGYYISTSLLIALDTDEKLVGIEAKANKRPIYQYSAPELLSLPSVGTAKEFDLEGCLALAPDLVLLPLKLKSAAETLATYGIDAICVNPESTELLTEATQLIATATNRLERAESLLTFQSEQNALLADLLADVSLPSVYLAGNSSFLSTAGQNMYQSSLISLAGGSNVAEGITDSYWVQIDYEQLLYWNPDYIILASDATYSVTDVLSDPNLASCNAVINQNVFQLPCKTESWDSPVPSSILGALYLANVLHPDAVSAELCNQLIDSYYEEFYGFTYSQV